jgi:hypothetical protein
MPSARNTIQRIAPASGDMPTVRRAATCERLGQLWWWSVVIATLLLPALAFAQTSSERAAVQLWATVQSVPARITLNWTTLPSTTSITVYRKTLAANSWGSAYATVGASATQYQDNAVATGTLYEYRVVRVAGGVTGNGYIATGIEVPVVDSRGKLILLVDNTMSGPLANEIQQLERDLLADGWTVLRSDVSRTASVQSVRNTVIGLYNSDPTNVKALFLLGHVPVPYSGNQSPDGHGEHTGAWPCDGYFGELTGTWTDNTINNAGAQRVENRNVPGDGKFDQSQFPSDLELQVGRVDLSDLPAFAQSETELLRAYLNKLHAFKIKGFTPQERGIVFDNLQWVSNPLAASGWRSLAPLVGPSNITAPYPYGSPFHTFVNGQSHLWTYSSGGGSQAYVGSTLTYNGANNVATTETYAGGVQMNGVFNMSFGSYFGDWDNKNNFLRAPLASGQCLTNCWSAIPAWYFHHMGMGLNIGYSAWRTMNNNSLYLPLTDGWQSSIGRAHLGLMGDPSLRMQMTAPPANLSIVNVNGYASFAWTASAESVQGYHLYAIDQVSGVPTRITTTAVTGTSYQPGTIPFVQGRQYMVRAVKLRVSQSGSYYDLSLGALGTAAGSGSVTLDCQGVAGGAAVPGASCNDGDPCTVNDIWNASCQCAGTPQPTQVTITAAGPTSFCTGGSVMLNATASSGSTYVWFRNATVISGATSSSYSATQAGTYTVQRTVSGCAALSGGVNVVIGNQPSVGITATGPTSFCGGGSVVLNATTGTGSTYVWFRNGTAISGATASSYTATQAGSYTVQRTVSGCSAISSAVQVVVTSAPTTSITAAGPTAFCSGANVVLNATTGTGSTYVWFRNGTAISGATASSYTASEAGSYTVQRTVSGCSGTSSAVVVSVTSAQPTSITAGGPTTFAQGGSVALYATWSNGSIFQWFRNGTAITGSTLSNTITVTEGGSYTVVRTLSGCGSTSAALTVVVTGTNTLTVSVSGTTTFCDGLSVVLSASTASGATYQWRRNNTDIPGATASSYTATQAGSYTVQRTVGGSSVTSGAVPVTVNPLPSLTMSSSPANATVSVAASGATAPYSYLWSTTPAQTTATATVTASGTYTVSVTAATGCRRNGSVSITLPVQVNCTGIRAESQGTWGANSNGYDPAAYMNSNFAAAFPAPNHLTIGCGSRLLRLSTAAAVGAFLPSYGSVAMLPTGTLANPGTSYSNNLAAELVALKLSMRFDEVDASFSPSTAMLKDMVISSGTFAGWTVQQLVTAADAAIGGCSSTYTLNTLNSALININYNYYQGSAGNGFLVCPSSGSMIPVQQGDASPELTAEEALELLVHPNPTTGPFTLRLSGTHAGEAFSVRLLTLDGREVAPLAGGADAPDGLVEYRCERVLAAGMYMVHVQQGLRSVVQRLIVE